MQNLLFLLFILFNLKIKLMNYSKISFFYKFRLISILFFLFSCANPQIPSGGPPDKTPPSILKYEPENQTTNFKEKYIRFQFSKYMDKSKVIENIIISPVITVNYNWSGKTLGIELPEDLDSTITYSITLGTEYTDIYGNKPESALSLIFSTGSKIDSGYISGKLIDKNPDGIYIYCYILDNINADTLNPATTFPNYKIQLGSNGEFKIPALKDAKYRIFAIKDEFKNSLYEPIDAYGSALNDIIVINSSSKPTQLKIGVPIDITSPVLTDFIQLNSNHYYLKFSKNIDENSISKNSFELVSEDNDLKSDIISAWLDFKNNNRIDFICDKTLDTSKVWLVKCLSNNEFSVKDTSGNLINDSLNIARIKPILSIDTSSIVFQNLPFKDSTEFIKVDSKFEFVFNKGIDTSQSTIKFNFVSSENKEKIPFEKIVKGNKIIIIPTNKLIDNKWFTISAEIKNLHYFNSNKYLDTNIELRFKSEDFKSKGSASGSVIIENELCNYDKYLVIHKKNSNEKYYSKLNEKLEWSFNNIELGDYLVELFCDVDGDGKYSFGKPYPYTYAEPFVIFNEELKIKPRWTLENVILKVKDI